MNSVVTILSINTLFKKIYSQKVGLFFALLIALGTYAPVGAAVHTRNNNAAQRSRTQTQTPRQTRTARTQAPTITSEQRAQEERERKQAEQEEKEPGFFHWLRNGFRNWRHTFSDYRDNVADLAVAPGLKNEAKRAAHEVAGLKEDIEEGFSDYKKLAFGITTTLLAGLGWYVSTEKAGQALVEYKDKALNFNAEHHNVPLLLSGLAAAFGGLVFQNEIHDGVCSLFSSTDDKKSKKPITYDELKKYQQKMVDDAITGKNHPNEKAAERAKQKLTPANRNRVAKQLFERCPWSIMNPSSIRKKA